MICTHFDHTQNRYVKGVNLLTALSYSQDVSLPVDFELIRKTELVTDPKTGKQSWQSAETKNAMLRRMVDSFIRKQVPFRHVLADIWFASVENMIFIKQKKQKDFVMPLKANRRVALSEADKQNNRFVPVASLPETSACQHIYLDKVPFPLLLITITSVKTDHEGKTRTLYLVTSNERPPLGRFGTTCPLQKAMVSHLEQVGREDRGVP